MILVHANSSLRSGYVELGSPCGCLPVDLQPPDWAAAPAWRPAHLHLGVETSHTWVEAGQQPGGADPGQGRCVQVCRGGGTLLTLIGT